jgi:DNA-binding transcriptional regulator YiaG
VGGQTINENCWRYEGEKDCEPLHYNWCGLDDVYLVSGYTRIPTEDGDDIVIKDMDGLHEAIGQHLAMHKKALNGKEIRFLRHEMDLTQNQLGDLLAVSDQTVARWEKQEVAIPGPAELLLRAFYLGHIQKQVDVRALAEQLRAVDAPITEQQHFVNDGTWKPLLAA